MSLGLNDEQIEQVDRVAGELEDGISDSYQLDQLRKATTRRDFAVIAANVVEDRYEAGSTAARLALIIALRHGIKAATDFVDDLAHHER